MGTFTALPSTPPNGEPTTTRRPTAHHLGTATKFLLAYKGRVILALLSLAVSAGAVLAVAQWLRWVIDAVISTHQLELLRFGLVILGIIIAVMTIGTYGRFYFVAWLGERVVADIRQAVYRNLMTLDATFYETNRTGDVLSRLTADTATVQSAIGVTLSLALRSAMLLVGGAGLMLLTDVRLTLISLTVVPLVIVPIIVVGRRVRRLSRESQDRLADVGARAEETLNAVRTVQAFSHETQDRDRFHADVEAAFGAARSRNAARAGLISGVVLLIFAGVGMLLWLSAKDVMSGALTGGEMSAFMVYAIIVAASVGALAEVAGDLYRAGGAIERLMELLDVQPTVSAPATPVALPDPPIGAVSFEDVTFCYPARPDTAAVDHLTLSIAPGETVALVGPSGAGKTTLLHLLLRFYDPQQGCVRLDGVDLRTADPQDIRRRIGLVPQEPVIFSANAWDNIRYGNPQASDDEVIEAARAARALEFIEPLPLGFNSFLGEKGIRLSVGQKQRIAIARALLRDPAVLLLDEATSSLDAESERLVQDALGRLMVGRTTIVIAHRLATVINANRLVVLDQGGVVAIGTHRELLDKSPLYATFAALQFGRAQAVG